MEKNVVKLYEVKNTDKPVNVKVLNTLEQVTREVKDKGFTQIAVVVSKPGDGYMATFATEEDPDGKPNGSIYKVLGTVDMLKRFIEDTISEGGQ